MKDPRTYYDKGSWNVRCQRCDAKRKSHEVVKQWNNLMVCKNKCEETRNPQDFLKSRPDPMGVPFSFPSNIPTALDHTSWNPINDDGTPNSNTNPT